jgi:hypothetical protein
MARSFRAHHAGARIVLCLVERAVSARCDVSDFDEVVLPADLHLDGLERFFFRHTVVEACTGIKARLLAQLLARFPHEPQIFYVDPDMRIYGAFDAASDLLRDHDVLVTPHVVAEEDDPDGIRDNELRTLAYGTYNLGFLGLRRSATTDAFLRWWHARLAAYCYLEIPRGLFVDQKWMDLASSFFEITVLRDPAYNVAHWNISKRKIVLADGTVLVNGQRLRCFHFSKVDSGRDMYYFRRYAGPSLEAVRKLRDEYKEELRRLGHAELREATWTYDYFASGERVLPESRITYRNHPSLQAKYPAPFGLSNETFLSA